MTWPTTDPPADATTKPRRRWWLGLAALAVVGMTAVCVAGLCKTGGGPLRGETAVSAAAPGGATGRAGAAVLTVATVHGSTFSAPAGHPAVLLFLTSQGCGECADAAATVDRVAQSNARGVSIVGVEMVPTASVADLDYFSRALGGLHYPLAIDTDGALQRRFQAEALSTVVVLDGAGRVVYRAIDPTIAALDAGLRKASA